MRRRTAFEAWAKGQRASHWDRFTSEDWRICSPGCPKEGEYANDLLQQLWECWKAARFSRDRA